MKSITISTLRDNITTYLNKISKNQVIIKIKTEKNNDVVIMSINEYNSTLTTYHEMSSALNQQRLDSAIQKVNNKNTFEKELIEL